jgi:transposase-like protein
MTPSADTERQKTHRLPGEMIRHGGGLSYRFPLSYRDVQALLFECGIDVTYAAIRPWCLKCGQGHTKRLRHQRPQPGDKWKRCERGTEVTGMERATSRLGGPRRDT